MSGQQNSASPLLEHNRSKFTNELSNSFLLFWLVFMRQDWDTLWFYDIAKLKKIKIKQANQLQKEWLPKKFAKDCISTRDGPYKFSPIILADKQISNCLWMISFLVPVNLCQYSLMIYSFTVRRRNTSSICGLTVEMKDSELCLPSYASSHRYQIIASPSKYNETRLTLLSPI